MAAKNDLSVQGSIKTISQDGALYPAHRNSKPSEFIVTPAETIESQKRQILALNEEVISLRSRLREQTMWRDEMCAVAAIAQKTLIAKKKIIRALEIDNERLRLQLGVAKLCVAIRSLFPRPRKRKVFCK